MKDYSHINKDTPLRDLPSVWPITDQLDPIVSQVLQYHPHLERKTLIFLFKKNMKCNGTAQVCSKQIKAILNIYNADADFIICLNWQVWNQLSDRQKRALLDHELEHCKYDEAGKPVMVEHDLEEFTAIVERHGLWTPGLQKMEQTMRRKRPARAMKDSALYLAK